MEAGGTKIGQFHKKGSISPKKDQFNKKGLPLVQTVKTLESLFLQDRVLQTILKLCRLCAKKIRTRSLNFDHAHFLLYTLGEYHVTRTMKVVESSVWA